MKHHFLISGVLCISAICGCTRVNVDDPANGQNNPMSAEDTSNRTLKCQAPDLELTYAAVGDQITSISQIFSIPLEEMDIPEGLEDAQIEEAALEALADAYAGIPGITKEAVLEEDHVQMKVIITVSEDNLEALEQAGLIEKGSRATNYISLDRTKKDLEAESYACTLYE